MERRLEPIRPIRRLLVLLTASRLPGGGFDPIRTAKSFSRNSCFGLSISRIIRHTYDMSAENQPEREVHYIRHNADETACKADGSYAMDVHQSHLGSDFGGFFWMIECTDCKEIAAADFT